MQEKVRFERLIRRKRLEKRRFHEERLVKRVNSGNALMREVKRINVGTLLLR